MSFLLSSVTFSFSQFSTFHGTICTIAYRCYLCVSIHLYYFSWPDLASPMQKAVNCGDILLKCYKASFQSCFSVIVTFATTQCSNILQRIQTIFCILCSPMHSEYAAIIFWFWNKKKINIKRMHVIHIESGSLVCYSTFAADQNHCRCVT